MVCSPGDDLIAYFFFSMFVGHFWFFSFSQEDELIRSPRYITALRNRLSEMDSDANRGEIGRK